MNYLSSRDEAYEAIAPLACRPRLVRFPASFSRLSREVCLAGQRAREVALALSPMRVEALDISD